MCNVTISIDEATLRKYNPSLRTHADIGQWAQQQMDNIMKGLRHTVTTEPPCTYNSIEDVIQETHRRIEEIDCGKAKLIPHEEVMRRMEELLDGYAN